LVTLENLKIAISRSLTNVCDKDQEWIDQIAQFVMDFFGYEERILDNRLTPRDRDIFYMLEGMDLLRTEMEEATIQKGKIWRIHYWILNKDKILEVLANEEPPCDDENAPIEGKVYDNLPENGWSRSGKD